MDLRLQSREYITKFIHLFRQNPCLWKINLTEYKNKKSRMMAYHRLLKLSKLFDPESTVDDVRKKIQSLRASHRKERRKVAKATKLEVHYVPRLWYYKDLEFLNNQTEDDTTEDINSSVDIDSVEIKQDIDDEDSQSIKSNISNPLSFDSAHETWEPQPASTSKPIEMDANPPFEENMPTNQYSLTNESTNDTLKLIARKLDLDRDEFDIFGRNVAAELRNMTNHQRIIAKKLMSDVIFHGRLQQLTLETQIEIK